MNQESFKGEIFHTAEFVNAKNNVGKKVVIIGTGVSAHDVAADHVENGVSEIVRYPPVWLSWICSSLLTRFEDNVPAPANVCDYPEGWYSTSHWL